MPFSHLSLLELRDRDADEDREVSEWLTLRKRGDSFARTSEPKRPKPEKESCDDRA